ncbi:MAG: ATP-dependent DNA helicase RecG [Candidatus Marinamargulisbacteria bacterium]
MLLNIDVSQARAIVASKLTPSQQSLMKRQGFGHPLSYLLLKPQRYLKRQYRLANMDLRHQQVYGLIGNIRSIRQKRVRKNLMITHAVLKTADRDIPVMWFNQLYILDKLSNDPWVVAVGTWDANGIDPVFQITQFETYGSLSLAGNDQVFPLYPDIRGVSNRVLVAIIQSLLKKLTITDVLPTSYQTSEALIGIDVALRLFHFPENQSQVALALKRFIFDELFIYLFPRRYRYANTKIVRESYPISVDHGVLNDYLNQLPYTLTSAQSRVWQTICHDFKAEKTVFRLIQGDVGSGKTDIAILSLLAAVGSGYKGALLVPTEILAEQHYLKLISRCDNLSVPIVLLKGKQSASQRRSVLSQLASSTPLIVVGTHALVQETVVVHELALVIIDEQHRFGVFQRQQLLEKSTRVPHCLCMSATPIPRTLMLTHYGDLDHDIIDTLPPGRKPPKTYYARPNRISQVYEFIRLELAAHRQAYIVYPLIDASEHLVDVSPAVDGFDTLVSVFPEYRIGLLHGKMPHQDKQRVMQLFKANELHVLVSTTVIEVGVDVPNASTMVIMNAERFGLSQLHQLRGRVGRGADQSHCFLIAEAKSQTSRQRIQAMQASSNGFDLAEEDLKIRGPGNLLGTQQSGELMFSFADLSNKERIQRIVTICDDIIQHRDSYANVFSFFDQQAIVSSVLLN